jgi:HlyD family secretion protein
MWWQNRRNQIIVGAAALALVVIIAGVLLLRRGTGAEEALYRTHTIESGELSDSVSATGSLEPAEQSALAFLVSGEVAEVLAVRGEAVEEGDVLARLDTGDLALSLQEAEITQQLQEIAYDSLTAGAGEYDVAAAQAAVYGASAQLQQLLEGPNTEAVQIAEMNLDIARGTLWQSQITRDRYRNEGYGDLASANRQVERDELAVEIAEQRLIDAQQGADQYSISGARASVAQAQAALNMLLAGPSDIDLEIAELQIDQAALSVDWARAALGDAEISAPFAGTVAEVFTEVGELVAAGTPVIVLIDDSTLHLDVLVDEIDIAQVSEGQPASITLDSLPDTEITGTVTYIAPHATIQGGVVSYLVRITLDPTDAPLRSGMTATAEIVTQTLEDVLLVPNWAVRLDRATGEAFVNIQREDGGVEEIPIVLGMHGDEYSEVVSGLEEGDVVVVSLTREELSSYFEQ